MVMLSVFARTYGRQTALLILTLWFFIVADRDAVAKDDDVQVCLYEKTIDGQSVCIRRERFNEDLCKTIEVIAIRHKIASAYFTRLIWRESLFRPEAISPKGAEGIAQFMPSTARLRGLANSFQVIEALDTSAEYLSELRARFGNLGLAAAAYNAGESSLARFLSTGRLPLETRDYVFAITGNAIETWRDNPPEIAAPALDDDKPFTEACQILADTRRMGEPVLARSADWAPWGVQLSAHRNPSIADRLFTSAILRLPAPLSSERALIVRQRGGNFGYRPRYAARIGKETRTEANKLCAQIQVAGVPCTVFKNR